MFRPATGDIRVAGADSSTSFEHREVHLGKHFTLAASDSHKLGAYRADPAGTPKGGIVVIQEIFGVNQHIRAVCDSFAKEGYVAVAPALFDRTQRDFQCGYTPPEIEQARTFVAKPDWDAMMRDTDAAIKELKSVGPIGIVGFCMGGTIAFLAATRLSGLSAAVGYYGGRIVAFADEKPKCPVLFNWGETDASIPLEKAKEVAAAHKDQIHYFYPGAGHGFNCEQRGSYNAEAAKLARTRTLEFLKKHIG